MYCDFSSSILPIHIFLKAICIYFIGPIELKIVDALIGNTFLLGSLHEENKILL